MLHVELNQISEVKNTLQRQKEKNMYFLAQQAVTTQRKDTKYKIELNKQKQRVQELVKIKDNSSKVLEQKKKL